MKTCAISLSLLVVLVMAGCKDPSCGRLPNYKPKKVVTETDIPSLKKEAAELEGSLAKGDSTEKLAQVYYKLGKAYLDNNNWDQAIESYEKALSYGKITAQTHYSLAAAYGNRGKDLKKQEDIAKAEKHYRSALELNPDFSDAVYGLSILLFYEKNDRAEGLRLMEKLTANNRSYYRGFFALGKYYYELNQPEKALSIYEDLCSELQKKSVDSRLIKEYQQACRENVQRLMQELSGSK